MSEIDLLKANVRAWNEWRAHHPDHHPDLSQVDLSKLKLADVNLRETNLRAAHLWQSDLTGSDFSQSNLREADLWRAKLAAANFCLADLQRAKLRITDLWEANFIKASLIHADLRGADLWRADFTGADLTHANLSGANLREANYDQAKGIVTKTESDALLEKIRTRIFVDGDGKLKMNDWHACETTHCIGGWACILAPQGRAWEAQTSTASAGSRLVPSAAHLFYATNQAAVKFLLERGWETN